MPQSGCAESTFSRQSPSAPSGNANSSVLYSNGAVVLAVSELTSPHWGVFFGHRRSYNNQMEMDFDGPNGWNWFVQEFPYAEPDGGDMEIVFDPNNSIWFHSIGGGNYGSRFTVPGLSLKDNFSTNKLTYTENQGGLTSVTVFNDGGASVRPWQFYSRTDPDGAQTTIKSLTGDLIQELQRVYTVSGTTTYESLYYTYFTSGANTGKIQTVTYRRGSGTSGPWINITQVSYTYYGTGSANGSLNDLMTATQQNWNGSSWDSVGVYYYRYYLAGASLGFAHGLKMDLARRRIRRRLTMG